MVPINRPRMRGPRCSAKQDSEGYWCGELQATDIWNRKYLLKWITAQENDPQLPLIAN